MNRVFCLCVVMAALGLLFAGCGSKGSSNRPKTMAVSGTVTQKGQPVADADVVFQPSGKSPAATGRTGADGKFSLTTFESGDGAVPGEYRVSVTKYEQAANAGTGLNNPDEYVPPTAASAQATAAPKNLLPAKYANGKTSTLTATVKESGENSFDFNLE